MSMDSKPEDGVALSGSARRLREKYFFEAGFTPCADVLRDVGISIYF
jgi:hypothetical protein